MAACTVDGVDDGQRNTRYRVFIKNGLKPGREYTSIIHCVADYYDTGKGAGNTVVRYQTGKTSRRKPVTVSRGERGRRGKS